jgi:hypothetical protein
MAICFEISVNGGPPLVAGAEDASVLSAMVALWPKKDAVEASVSGIRDSADGGEHLSWLSQMLAVGDSLTVRVVESNTPADPIKRTPRDVLFPKQKEREYYEHLKRKYGP